MKRLEPINLYVSFKVTIIKAMKVHCGSIRLVFIKLICIKYVYFLNSYSEQLIYNLVNNGCIPNHKRNKLSLCASVFVIYYL